jgi:hypothetical protein
MDYDPLDADADPFKPPAIPTEVGCLHCHQVYESYLIEWRVEVDDDGPHGFWCCPTPDCDGRGFGFDILPTDPEYQDENGGWVWFDDEDAEDGEDEAELGPDGFAPPAEPADRPPPREGDEDLPW